MKKNLILAVLGLMAAAAYGQQILSTNVTINSVVPDNNANGLAEGIDIGGLSGAISSVTVNVDITGGFNGDLYAYLAGPAGGFAVLLNRVGVGATSANGYGDQGFNVTFDDAAANGSIHDYQSTGYPGSLADGQVTGTWQPDGENIDPQSASAAFPTGQTAMLSSFSGLDGNGEWVFFIADLSPGGQSTLQSFALTIMTVPEPSTISLGLLAGLAGLGWVGRSRRRSGC